MATSLALGCWSSAAADLVERDDVSPRGLHGVDGGTTALHDVLHATAEDAVHADDGFIATFQEIGGDALHASHAGAADGEGEGVFGLKNLPQHLAHLVHDGDVLRVEVPQGWGSQGTENPGGNWARSGAEQDAFCGMLGVHGSGCWVLRLGFLVPQWTPSPAR
jgi:hypothetical protein